MFCVFLLFFHSVIVRNLAISSSDSCRNRVISVYSWIDSWATAPGTFPNHYRAFSVTRPASMPIYWNKRKHLHVERVQLPQDFLGTPTWPPFHCFRTPIWPPWRHVKTLYTMDQLRFQVNIYTIDGIIDGILLASSKLRYYDAHSWWNTHYRRSKT